MVFPLKAHEPGYKGRCKNNDEASTKERKEIQRLPRLSLVLEFDEFVRSVGAAAGKALICVLDPLVTGGEAKPYRPGAT
jgi:hypothetical protein